VTRDGHVIRGPGGPIRIPGDALSALVVTAAEQVDGARVRRPRRGLDVSVESGRARVELELAARYGTSLPQLGEAVQSSVASALRDAAGLDVDSVDVSFEELDL
jgi:uncharacterized alkaline shock family protein YloU